MKHLITHKATILATILILPIVFISSAMSMPYGSASYGACKYGALDGCSISISTSGTINLSLTGSVAGTYTVQKDSINIVTDNYAGYVLSTESGSGSTGALINGANSIAASSGTPASPQSLAMNTWGYRLDGTGGFGAGPTSAVTNASSTSLSFAGLTLGGSSTQIYSSNAKSGIGGDNIDVWYGVGANISKQSGTYTQTVVYTAVTIP